MSILRRKTCYITKCPNIPRTNKFFDLSVVGFNKMAQFIALFILLWSRMLSLIDWLVCVIIIWIIFLSMNVAHAKSGSRIRCSSGLTLGLFVIMYCGAWQIFCLGFVAVQVAFLVTASPFFSRGKSTPFTSTLWKSIMS